MQSNRRLRPRKMPELISLVIPLFNEGEVFSMLRKRLEKLESTFPCAFEFILVEDGSSDDTISLAMDWAEEKNHVKVIELSRNFGHQVAVTAGLDHATGDAVVLMDGDLQDPPELIPEMVKKFQEGYDVVYAQRSKRNGESRFKLWTASMFYSGMQKFVYKHLPSNAGDFRLMSQDAALALGNLREGHRFIRGMVAWLGFEQVAVPYERESRPAGISKYPLSKMTALAWDAVLSFSSAPLKVGLVMGAVVFTFGVGMGVYSIVLKLSGHNLVPGWPSLVVLQCTVGGAVLVSLGLIGEYVGRIYDELKQRPIYIVRRSLNLHRATYSRAVTPRQVDFLSRDRSEKNEAQNSTSPIDPNPRKNFSR